MCPPLARGPEARTRPAGHHGYGFGSRFNPAFVDGSATGGLRERGDGVWHRIGRSDATITQPIRSEVMDDDDAPFLTLTQAEALELRLILAILLEDDEPPDPALRERARAMLLGK